jgi:hypothetical protein
VLFPWRLDVSEEPPFGPFVDPESPPIEEELTEEEETEKGEIIAKMRKVS